MPRPVASQSGPPSWRRDGSRQQLTCTKTLHRRRTLDSERHHAKIQGDRGMTEIRSEVESDSRAAPKKTLSTSCNIV